MAVGLATTQKYPQRHKSQTQKKCHLHCKRVRSSTQHESIHKRPSHITTYSTNSLPQQRTVTTRKQSQSLRWQRRCTESTSCDTQLGGVPCASIRIKNIHYVGNKIQSYTPNASDLQNSTSRHTGARHTSQYSTTHRNHQTTTQSTT